MSQSLNRVLACAPNSYVPPSPQAANAIFNYLKNRLYATCDEKHIVHLSGGDEWTVMGWALLEQWIAHHIFDLNELIAAQNETKH